MKVRYLDVRRSVAGADHESDAPPGRQAAMGMGTVRTAVACWAGLLLLVSCSNEAPKPQVQISVPNLYELRLNTADAALQSVGLRSAGDLEGPCPSGMIHADGNNEPIVFNQQPAAGSKLSKGSVVHLHVC
jgi:hypothetical protein